MLASLPGATIFISVIPLPLAYEMALLIKSTVKAALQAARKSCLDLSTLSHIIGVIPLTTGIAMYGE
jgi:hypothetical protein